MNTPRLSADCLPIIFYDSDCALCHRFVRRVFKRDQGRRLRFAPLTGETARMLIGDETRAVVGDTVLFLDESGLTDRSTAALRICSRLGGVYRLAVLGRLLPRRCRDAVYDMIASRRHAARAPDVCELPTNARADIFLP